MTAELRRTLCPAARSGAAQPVHLGGKLYAGLVQYVDLVDQEIHEAAQRSGRGRPSWDELEPAGVIEDCPCLER